MHFHNYPIKYGCFSVCKEPGIPGVEFAAGGLFGMKMAYIFLTLYSDIWVKFGLLHAGSLL
jgi:hypothetical protein